MAVPESQLDTWSKQGSVTQSRQTYGTVKGVLESSSAPYAGKSYSVFLQGSYGNDTNIYADSDVDAVIALDTVFYSDLHQLSEEEKQAYEKGRSAGGYSYDQFKAGVVKHLTDNFGQLVKPGKKAIFIQGGGNRRDCDVLAAVELRRFTRFKSWSDYKYNAGICFWTSDGTRIINFPKQHSANCTAKHQRTGSWFKPCVRILKNMRNCMVEKGYLKEGVAPSYFLEGLLYNVPDSKFGGSYGDSIVNSVNWILTTDRSQFVCANEMYYLCHPTSPVTWRSENLQAFLEAFVRFWNDW
jgi:hypothetical protein